MVSAKPLNVGDKVVLGNNSNADFIYCWRSKRSEYYPPIGEVVVRTVFNNGNFDFVNASGAVECWNQDGFVRVQPTPSVAADLRLKPQAKTVLRHLKTHGHISPAKAYVVYGMTRLAASIFEIRKVGYEITTTIHEDEQGHKYSEYTMAKPT